MVSAILWWLVAAVTASCSRTNCFDAHIIPHIYGSSPICVSIFLGGIASQKKWNFCVTLSITVFMLSEYKAIFGHMQKILSITWIRIIWADYAVQSNRFPSCPYHAVQTVEDCSPKSSTFNVSDLYNVYTLYVLIHFFFFCFASEENLKTCCKWWMTIWFIDAVTFTKNSSLWISMQDYYRS